MSTETSSAGSEERVPDVPVLSLIVTDAGGKIVSLNEGAEQLFGWRRDEVLGKSVAMMHTEEGVRQFSGILADAVKSKYEGALEFKRKDGSRFRGHLQVVSTKDSAGRVTSYIGITHEIRP